MRAVVQRVRRASVAVGERVLAEIGPGAVVLIGVERGDGTAQAEWLAKKILALRCFQDGQRAFQHSVLECHAALLVVPQFTLLADCRQGRRPDFSQAAPAEDARTLYEVFLERLRQAPVTVEGGAFREQMVVKLENDGPVTFVLDTSNRRADPTPSPG